MIHSGLILLHTLYLACFFFFIRHLSSVSNFSWYWNTFAVKSAIDIDITGTYKGIVIYNRIPRVPLKVEVISKLHSIS